MTYSNVAEASSSWKGLFGCLGTGILVIALVVLAFRFFGGRVAATEQRVTAEFLTPYLETLRAADPAKAYDTLTTTAFRAQHSRETFTTNFNLALQKLGKPQSVKITKVHSTTQPGRSYQRVSAEWAWERGPAFLRTFELVDVPDAGYRVDEVKLSPQAPKDAPEGPW